MTFYVISSYSTGIMSATSTFALDLPSPSSLVIFMAVSIAKMDLLSHFAGTNFVSAVSDGDNLFDYSTITATPFVLHCDDYLFSSNVLLLNFW
jgi:hypothetical protein